MKKLYSFQSLSGLGGYNYNGIVFLQNNTGFIDRDKKKKIGLWTVNGDIDNNICKQFAMLNGFSMSVTS